jgi:hypothetical protein
MIIERDATDPSTSTARQNFLFHGMRAETFADPGYVNGQLEEKFDGLYWQTGTGQEYDSYAGTQLGENVGDYASSASSDPTDDDYVYDDSNDSGDGAEPLYSHSYHGQNRRNLGAMTTMHLRGRTSRLVLSQEPKSLGSPKMRGPVSLACSTAFSRQAARASRVIRLVFSVSRPAAMRSRRLGARLSWEPQKASPALAS